MEFPEKIETERLHLMRPKPVTFNLAKEMYAAVDFSRETLRKWLPWVDRVHSAEDEFSSYLSGTSQKWDQGEAFDYIVRDKKNNTFYGTIGMMHVSTEHKSGEIGYWLSNNAVGYGYMTEAVQAMTKMAFEIGLNRVVIRNDTENTRSVNVPKRLGFHLDGVMRQEKWSPYFQNMRDMNIWSKLRED